VVLGGEPLLELTAPLPQAQLMETWVLNQISYRTAQASKAARSVLEPQPSRRSPAPATAP
jgi:nicotinate phosphoribosyltransferase